jgi:hypothetical protein
MTPGGLVKLKQSALGALSVVALVGSSLAFGATSANAEIVDKVTICHRTNSDTNPYVVITPDVAGVLDGHANKHDDPRVWNDTLKAQHLKWGDIIPPFEYDGGTFLGLNWTAEGQAIYNNGTCVAGNPEPELVDLSVAKLVVGTVPQGVANFTAQVTCDDGTSEAITLPIAGGLGTPSPIEVELGSQCTVVETATGGASSVGYSIVGVDVDPGVFIDTDTTVTITNTFTSAPPVGPEVAPEVVSAAPAVAPAAVTASPALTG